MSKDKDKKKPGNENFEVLVQLFPWLEEQEGGPGGAPGGKKPDPKKQQQKKENRKSSDKMQAPNSSVSASMESSKSGAGRDSLESYPSHDDISRGGDFDRDGDFDESLSDSINGSPGFARSKMVSNQPFDEAVEVSDGDSMRDSLEADALRGRGDSPPTTVAADQDGESDDDMMHHTLDKTSTMMYNAGRGQVAPSQSRFPEQDDDEDESSSDDDIDMSMDPTKRPGQVYGKIDMSSLNVSSELRELFEYITRFTPTEIELDTKLKPFIPEYIPSVGDIDAFIKVPRPDEKADYLGLNVLDEPSAKQSEPAVLEMKLQQFARGPIRSVQVHSIENAEKNRKAVATWIDRISELHQGKPPPNVQYAKTMPGILNSADCRHGKFQKESSTNRHNSADLCLPGLVVYFDATRHRFFNARVAIRNRRAPQPSPTTYC